MSAPRKGSQGYVPLISTGGSGDLRRPTPPNPPSIAGGRRAQRPYLNGRNPLLSPPKYLTKMHPDPENQYHPAQNTHVASQTSGVESQNAERNVFSAVNEPAVPGGCGGTIEAHERVPAHFPPRSERFYESLSNYEQNQQCYSEKFEEAMGITRQTYEVMIAKANELLPPGEALNFRYAEHKKARDRAAAHLVEDPNVGKYFRRSFSALNYPYAHGFFQKAASKFIMITNNTRKAQRARASSKATSEESDYDETIHAKHSHPPSASTSSKRQKTSRLSSKFSGIQSLETEDTQDMAQETIEVTPLIEQTIPRNAQVIPQTACNTQKIAQGGLRMPIRAMLPNTLEITGFKKGHSIPVGLSELFKIQETTPQPCKINIATIRARCNMFQKRRGLPELSDDDLWFKFKWDQDRIDREMDVFDDPSLRYAYRIWLAQGDVDVPFVLCVDGEDLKREKNSN